MRTRILEVALLGLAATSAFAQTARLAADTYIHSDLATVNFGALPILNVDSKSTALVRFDLSVLPAGTTASSVAKAMLTVYVSRVMRPGLLLVQPLSGAWGERTVNFASRPIGGLSFPPVEVTAPQNFVSVEVTSLVQQWLSGTPNDGLALASDPGAGGSFTLDSKEDTSTGHAAKLEITLSGPAGPQGLQGPAGPRGLAGPQGAPGSPGISGWQLITKTAVKSSGFTVTVVEAFCPVGSRVLGGGCDAIYGFDVPPSYFPPQIFKATPNGTSKFQCTFDGGTGINMPVAAVAVCGNVQ